MLTPEEIDKLTEVVGRSYDRLQDELMYEVARKIRKGLDLGASIQWDVKKILQTGGAWDKEILARIQNITGLSRKQVKSLLYDAGLASIKRDSKLLKEMGSPVDLPLKMSSEQLRVIRAGIRKVDGFIGNLANVSLDSTFDKYHELLTDAYNLMASGSYSLGEATKKVCTKLVNDGVATIQYASGRRDKIEVAVRRAMRTSTNQTMLALGEQNAKEVGSNLVEVSAHSGARPSHALWQGKVYSLDGGTKKYPNLRTATGYGTITGLGGVNCRHNFFPFFENVDKPEYSSKQLEEMREKNVTYNGKQMTEYEASQIMRKYEREIRRQKRLEQFAGKNTAPRQIALRRQMRSLSQQTGIPIDSSRTRVFKPNA